MATYNVTFLPAKRKVSVGGDKTLLEAAESAGVKINSVCGAEGLCGRCKVRVCSGEVWAPPTPHLSREEIQQGYVLACTALARSDSVIDVPVETRLEGAPHLTKDEALRFGSTRVLTGRQPRHVHGPLARKYALSLPPPTLEDNIGDTERVFRELRRDLDIPIMQMGLAQIKCLSALLRESDWKVTVTLGQRGGTVEVMQVEGGDTSSRSFGVAVDIGTTTVVAHLVDLNTSETVGRQASYNSQIQYGEDVISRIMSAENREKLARLSASVIQDINDLVTELVKASGVSLHDVVVVMCAGNTAMMHLLMEIDPRSIRVEPYVPAVAVPPVVRAAEVGIKINPRGLLAYAPAVACYVGGDVVADALVAGMGSLDELSLLIDMGTNGELVVGNKDWLVCCSASAGPAFEGGGISCGMRATNGAIERLSMRQQCEVTAYSVIGGGKPVGLCGSGLIDAIAEMLNNGCMERNGTLTASGKGCGRLREGDNGLEFVLLDASQTATGKDIFISQADVRNFIRAKGAIYHAAECLLSRMELDFTDLQNVFISGGFGNYVDVHKAIMIGLLPDLPRERFQFIGNGSVEGAKMMLLSRQAMAEAQTIASRMTYIELSSDPKFMNEYTSALFLPHTHLEKFPSVRGVAEGASAGV